MKKTLIPGRLRGLSMSVIAAFALIMSASAPASAHDSVHGEKTLGVMGGYASYNNSGYTNLYFQYTFSRHVRIAPEVGYVFSHNGESALDMSVDMQFPFRVARGFQIYPLAGVTFNNWNYSYDGHDSRLGGDVGAGLELYFTSNLKMTLQAKYSIMPNTSGAFVGLGLGYIF